MNILFVRHGESVDDLTDQYGGWGDFDLTPKGHLQVQDTAEKIKDLDVDFSKVLASPLLRAQQSARLIANTLSLPLETFVYAKEKNVNGLLTGLNREDARKSYPELVAAWEQGYVFGAETGDKFIERVKFSIDLLLERKQPVIVVTHGGYMSVLFSEILNYNYEKTHDGGFVLVKGDSLDSLEVDTVSGIDYSHRS